MGLLLLSLIIVPILTFIGVYFLFRFFSTGISPLKKVMYWITAIIATPIVYVGLIYIWFSISSSFPERTFDKQGWENNPDQRYEYTDDLVDNKKLIGLTNSEVEEMLGEPDEKNDSTLVFYIGYCPKYFMNMDPDWLELELKDGKIYNSRILQ
jgi:hypothetical protein